jgi:hypothetical protein
VGRGGGGTVQKPCHGDPNPSTLIKQLFGTLPPERGWKQTSTPKQEPRDPRTTTGSTTELPPKLCIPPLLLPSVFGRS